MKTNTALSLLLSLLAVACSGSSSNQATVVTPGAQITAENAEQIALVAIDAAFGFGDVAGIGGGLLQSPPPPPVAPATLQGAAGRALDAALLAQAALGASTSATIDGPGGGQVVQTWEDRDADERISAGDAFLSAFAQYASGDLELSGLLSVVVQSTAGTPTTGSSWTIRGRMSFVDLTVTIGEDVATLAGSVAFVRERRPTVAMFDLLLDDGLEFGDLRLQPGTRIDQHEFPNEFLLAVSSRGAVEVDGIDGLVHFEATQPFTGLAFPGLAWVPWAGELEVRGAGDSLITVRMKDDFSSTVQILVDADGDDEIDETLETPWTSL